MWTFPPHFASTGATGLTLLAALVVNGTIDPALRDLGVGSGGVTLVEQGGGFYSFSFSQMPDNWVGEIVLYTTALGNATTFAGSTIYGGWDVEQADECLAKTTVGGLATASVLAGLLAQFTGVGPYTLTVTVTDSVTSSPIAGAQVAIGGSQSAMQWTNGSGVAVLAFAAGTFTVMATSPNYGNYASSQTQTGNASLAISLVARSTPPTPGSNQITGELFTRDQTGTIVTGKVIQFQMIGPPQGEAGNSYDQSILQVTSDGSGYVAANLVKGATYNALTTRGVAVQVVVPTAGTIFALPDVLGQYA